ncbi:MAG: radical SAM protein [Anaerolineae bacterium]|nr:radical SAM protein [Anaerolineae bacterium]MCO5186927.1 radical SAM protein [Anaerolineae bacterium]MCO5192588.1 radical SAM protein [Anaerolineae bacterium]MCO5199188.1 radical SAM protein [Anaerolineae bacterium]MCO5203640.1 radical SAM protein [Anaerolineae bacterium]
MSKANGSANDVTDKSLKYNLGTRRVPKLRMANFPNADDIVLQGLEATPRSENAVDIVLVNPPTPDGGLWIRTQHRVGRRTRENMVWPQVSLAQMAAMLHPQYKVAVIDANAERMNWPDFTKKLEELEPKYYLTQVTAPTLENDMYGVFLAKARGITTMAFGTHVTPIPRETMKPYPSLDYILLGEPDLTLRDLLDHLEGKIDQRPPNIEKIFADHDPDYRVAIQEDGGIDMGAIKGIVWRYKGDIIVNFTRPFIKNLSDMPLPMHHLLPLDKYRMPLIKGPFTFIVTSRGCPAGCTYCIKHVSYQYTTRLRTPEDIMEELWLLKKLGMNNIHMYADLFTVNRDQVMGLCELMIKENINIRWTCNSRVDYVDEELLQMMAKAGNWLISWGIESGNEQVLRHARKGAYPDKALRALTWAREAGIKNWGYFIIGLPTETEETIKETIAFSKTLPLDIALFHVAAPYPGTPFFFEVVENGWFRSGTRWEQVDMDQGTVLDYPGLSAERLLYWQKRAFREWAMRPEPMKTYMKMLISDPSTLRSALNVGWQHLSWVSTDTGAPVSS